LNNLTLCRPNNSIATTELSLSEDKAPGVYALSPICSLVFPQLNEKGEGDFPSLFRSAPSWLVARRLADAAMPALSEDQITALLPPLTPRA
jgi:hypothetical protein